MNASNWKPVDIEYGKEIFQVSVPPWCDILKMKNLSSLENPKDHIEYSLSHPYGSPPVEDIITPIKKKNPKREICVAIAVSDNTRPVPYNGEKDDGILLPLLLRLKQAGIKKKNTMVVVATGTHIPTTRRWKEETFGRFIFDNYEIADHDCTSKDLCSLVNIDGVEVKINPHFFNADIRIVTGLVEPHFMAGFSGGRKAVCPGLVNIQTTHLFHSAEYMDNPDATNLVMKDNPCHDFSLQVAQKIGVDFSVNAVLNGDMKLAGVFAGDVLTAHQRAVELVMEYSIIPIDKEYDIVLSHGGRVAVNHYQAAKAAYSVIPIIKRGGVVILVAHNGDEESIGKDEYKKVIKLLRDKGPGKFTDLIKSEEWQFVPDQWQVQKWDQFFKKLASFEGLIYCTTGIKPEELQKLPGRSGYEFVRDKQIAIEEMVQNAVNYACDKVSNEIEKPKMAFIKEGPYAIPAIVT